MNPLLFLGLGLALGLRHAADPDHVVAVAAISARTGRVAAAVWLGVVWGLGHALTLLAAGMAIIVLGLAVPERIGLALELAVAVVLVVVGLANLGGASRPRSSSGTGIPAWRAFGVGLVHGLAGSAALALLVMASSPGPWWSVAYLLMVGLGTLLGMVLISTGVASPIALAGPRLGGLAPRLQTATGMLSVGLGLWMVYQIGWVNRLFFAAPRP